MTWLKLALWVVILNLCAVVVGRCQNSFDARITYPKGGIHFSPQATDREISAARIFDEPLVPIGRNPSFIENNALATTLANYSGRTNFDDFSSLTDYLTSFPQSPWNASLMLHLGSEYYHLGYYSKALDAFTQSWVLFKQADDPAEKAQADRALGELARMYSKLGRMQELSALLESTSNRPITGPGTQLILAAKGALWMMQHHPEVSFKCGPAALDQIRSFGDSKLSGNKLLESCASTTNGFALAQVAALSDQLGMKYQMAFRSSGASLIVPAVAHWKAGHYAALLKEEGDRYLVRDYTFQSSLWMSKTAIDLESSGYFLIPSRPLPSGWHSVSAQEGQQIFGKGVVSGQQQGTCTPCDTTVGDSGSCSSGANDATTTPTSLPSLLENGVSSGMTTFRMHAMLVNLNLNDRPVGYHPPVGPNVYFTARYNQQDEDQPATFYYSNLGPKWTCSWISYITDNPTSPNADVSWYVNGGGTLNFMDFNGSTYQPELMTQAQLTKTSASSYEMLLADGSKQEFTQSDGSTGTSRRVFLTQIIDPAGNSLFLNYDSSLRITNVTDAIGQVTTLSYTNTSFPCAITSVTDPFGRTAYFQYTSAGLLSEITDVLGLTSQYQYGTNDFINSLVTPYGTTTFTGGLTNGVSWLQATDPLGESELLEFNMPAPIPAEPGANIPNGMGTTDVYLNNRNSFYWSKKAFAEGAGDYTKAKIFHWTHWPNAALASPVIESEKEPLENRIWYDYPGQVTSVNTTYSTFNKPSVVGRVLDDGTTQEYFYQYNQLGRVINTIDPVGRNFTYIYSNNAVDLLQVRMTHNGQNQLLSNISYNSQHLPLTVTDAAGNTTTNTYNARGQLLSIINALGEVTTFGYNTNGYLLSVIGHLQSTNDVYRFTYDNFGRIKIQTDTEGYTVTFSYDAMDRVTNITYPDTTFEQFIYSNLDLFASCDRLGRWTMNMYNADRQLTQTCDPLGRITSYDWCHCGALTGLTDPMGRTTTWDYDVESRPIAKHYVDGSTITYVYENTTSRLNSKFDEKGQQTLYRYYVDNNLEQVSYPNATVATPTVILTYDPDYNRVLTMQDGIGTTTYTYIPINAILMPGSGQLASVSGPLPNSLVVYQYDSLNRVVSRSINGVAQTINYDVLDRPIAVTNVLGEFQYSYADSTERLASEAYPNGQTNLYTYYGNIADQRLLQIEHLYPNGSMLSGFGYVYNSVGQITAVTNQWDSIPQRIWLPSYDKADQLTNIVSIGGYSAITNYTYAYDTDGNRLVEVTNGTQTIFTYNALNQLSDSTLPTNNIGYEWDAENRLAAINNGVNRSEFCYDGFGRRTHFIEKVNGSIVSNNFFLWCGVEICEQRDSSGANVVNRYYNQGEQNTGENFYYTRDILGSVREALDSHGKLLTRYDYDPYGQLAILQENQPVTFAYGGNFIHRPSGLYFTLFRSLDSSTGRWLSRDPIGEFGGINLYSYAANNSINAIDPSGLLTTITTTSKTVYQFSTARDFVNTVNSLGDDKIQNITFAGHANQLTQGIGDTRKRTEILTLDPDGNLVVVGPSINNNPVSLGTLLAGKMAANATIDFEGCNAGSEEATPGNPNGVNLPLITSEVVPNVVTSGSSWETHGPPDVSEHNYHWPGTLNTYLNGRAQ